MVLYAVSNGGVSDPNDVDQYYNLLTGTTTDQPVTVSNRITARLTGATVASGYVGGFAGFAPTAGTFAAGDFGVGQYGTLGVCAAPGTPGTWQAAPTGVSTQALVSPAASVTFSAIPAFSTLKVFWRGRTDAAGSSIPLLARVNGDTGTNYQYQFHQAYGAAGGNAGGAVAQSALVLGHVSSSTATANYWSGGEITINGWSSTVGYMTITSLSSTFLSGASSCFTEEYSNQYTQVTTYTSLTLFPSAGNFLAGSVLSLYGYA